MPQLFAIPYTSPVMNPADLFRQETDPIRLQEGDALFREGEPADCMYVLLEGGASVIVSDTVVENAVPGALLGEMALIGPSRRSASVIATSPCKVAKIDQRRFHFLIQHTPNFATHVMKVLSERLRHMNSLTREG